MIKKRKTLEKSEKVKVAFDIDMLNALIKYIRCDYVTQPQKNVVLKLMESLDLTQYDYSPDIKERIELIIATCKGMCVEHISDESVLLSYIKQHYDDAEEVIAKVNFERNGLIDSECKSINKFVNERIQMLYVLQVKDEIINKLRCFDTIGFTSYQDDLNTLKECLSKLLVKLQGIASPDEIIRSFNFSGDQYKELLARIVEKARKPTTTLMTGIRQLNAILSPGFQSGRLYTILGGTGRFKSGTLWNITDQIRLFNPQIIPVENGMRKVLLFVTMENTIYETILRLIDMYNPTAKDVSEMDVEEVAQILRDEGHFEFTSESGIDIEMRYYSDLEIATSNLYTLIQELADQGKQVIGLILDYILKIDSAKEHYGDERLRLSYVGRELKALAQYYDIPVITAMQINREGNGILEASMQESKEDIARFVGASYVGQCWDIIQESDWVCFINLEMQKSTGKWFLTFKRLKIRGKKDPMAVDYFNHPFTNNNGIRLEPDVNKPEPISVISLASDLVNVNDPKPENSARERPKVSSGRKSSEDYQIVSMEGLLKAS